MDDLLLQYSGENPDAFTKLLRSEITRIWEQNPERLLAILYRIDIKESIVKQAFALGQSEEAFELLATAIVERMNQKIFLRNKYRDI